MQKFAFLASFFDMIIVFNSSFLIFSLFFGWLTLRKWLFFENYNVLSIEKKILNTPNILIKFSNFDSKLLVEDEFPNFFHYFFHDLWAIWPYKTDIPKKFKTKSMKMLHPTEHICLLQWIPLITAIENA